MTVERCARMEAAACEVLSRSVCRLSAETLRDESCHALEFALLAPPPMPSRPPTGPRIALTPRPPAIALLLADEPPRELSLKTELTISPMSRSRESVA